MEVCKLDVKSISRIRHETTTMLVDGKFTRLEFVGAGVRHFGAKIAGCPGCCSRCLRFRGKMSALPLR